jgi:hypothetical protein
MDRVHVGGSWVNGPPLNNSRWFFDLWFWFNEVEGVSLDIIVIVGDAMDGSGFSQTESGGAARPHGDAMAERGGLLGFRFSRAMVVGFRWGLLLWERNDKGNSFMLTLFGVGWQRGLAMARWLGWPRVTMCAASDGALASRTGWEPSLRPPLAPCTAQLLQETVKDRVRWSSRVQRVLWFANEIQAR